MLITDCHIKFKEQIDLNEEFNVTMTLGRYKKINNLFLAYTHFNFDNNKALGDLKLVFLT